MFSYQSPESLPGADASHSSVWLEEGGYLRKREGLHCGVGQEALGEKLRHICEEVKGKVVFQTKLKVLIPRSPYSCAKASASLPKSRGKEFSVQHHR